MSESLVRVAQGVRGVYSCGESTHIKNKIAFSLSYIPPFDSPMRVLWSVQAFYLLHFESRARIVSASWCPFNQLEEATGVGSDEQCFPFLVAQQAVSSKGG